MALHIALCLSTSFRSFRLLFLSLSQVKIVVEIPLMLMKRSRHDNCSEMGGITLRVVRLFEEMMRIQFSQTHQNRFYFSSLRHFSHWKWSLKVTASWNSFFSSFASLATFQVEGRQKRQTKYKKKANKWNECLHGQMKNGKWKLDESIYFFNSFCHWLNVRKLFKLLTHKKTVFEFRSKLFFPQHLRGFKRNFIWEKMIKKEEVLSWEDELRGKPKNNVKVSQ